MDSDTYEHDECSYLNRAKRIVMDDCRHLVASQEHEYPKEDSLVREPIQKCCLCGMVRTQELMWGPWRRPWTKVKGVVSDGL